MTWTRQALTERFEADRPRLRSLAYRMLGSLSEAEDAVQETWVRLDRIDATDVDNLGGWLTTVLSRVCLDMLRSRRARREESIEAPGAPSLAVREERADPEAETMLADSVGVALLVVLEFLTPAERLAFVLHDLFGMGFDEIGSILGRTTDATKQLASRARRRVRGSPLPSNAGRARQRALVEAFLGAVYAGDLEGLLAVLDPEAVLRIDGAARIAGGTADAEDAPRELHGAATWAARLLVISRGMRFVEPTPALIGGSVGLLIAPGGRLTRALLFAFGPNGITRIEFVGDPVRLSALEVAVLAPEVDPPR